MSIESPKFNTEKPILPRIEYNPNENKPEPNKDKDVEYSNRFWQKQPKGMEEAMRSSIESAAKDGFMGIFVNPEGIDEKDKERLSAYRELARKMGYEVGPFHLNKDSHSAKAEIKKVENKN